jgi:hypothetical protein
MTYDLHVRLGDDLADFLRAYAEARGITITTALSVILSEARAAQASRPA